MAKENVYGLCPRCGRPGVQRERSPNGNTTCEAGHVYPHSEAVVYRDPNAPKVIESFAIEFIDRGAGGKILKADMKIDGHHFGGIAEVEGEKIPLSRGFGLALVALSQKMAKIVEDTLKDDDDSKR